MKKRMEIEFPFFVAAIGYIILLFLVVYLLLKIFHIISSPSVEEMFLITVFGFLIANSPSYILIKDLKEKVEEKIERVEKEIEIVEKEIGRVEGSLKEEIGRIGKKVKKIESKLE
jgi:hypothetical protein